MKYKIEKTRCEDGLIYYKGYLFIFFFWIPITFYYQDKEEIKKRLGLY